MVPETDTDREDVAKSEIPGDARTSRLGLPENQAVLEGLLREARRECDGLRAALAAETEVTRRDRAAARASVDRAQDLDAALFRLCDQLKLARMDADVSYMRVLDLEQQLHVLGEHHGSILQDLQQARAHLGQALALHEHEAIRWQAEIDLLRAQADATARMLADVLASRSWRSTRLLRHVVAGARGRRWVEPQAPTIPRPMTVVRPRNAGEESND